MSSEYKTYVFAYILYSDETDLSSNLLHYSALIRQKFGVGEAKFEVEQARKGSANENHFCK